MTRWANRSGRRSGSAQFCALKNPACSGVFLWQFADCRVTEEWAMHRPKTHNNKGVVDEYRRPKMSYAVVKELFQKQKG